MNITRVNTNLPIKNNGTAVVTCSFAGVYATMDSGFQSPLNITNIQSKYDEKFPEGIIVRLAGNQTLIGG